MAGIRHQATRSAGGDTQPRSDFVLLFDHSFLPELFRALPISFRFQRLGVVPACRRLAPAFLGLGEHGELLQMLVQRVNPDLTAEGDGIVVDAILSIDTTRPSLKPLYRSALQVRMPVRVQRCNQTSGCHRGSSRLSIPQSHTRSWKN